jgi:hypothetical protein
VHEVSGMKAACGPERVFNRSSPTVLIEQLTPEQVRPQGDPTPVPWQ